MQEIPGVLTMKENTSSNQARKTSGVMSVTLSLGAALLLAAMLMPVAGCKQSPNADIVATVNGHAIMKADLDKAYANQLGEQQQQAAQSTEEADSLRLNLLHDLILEEIIEQRAAKMNLTAPNEEVDAKLAEMKAPYTEEQFQDKLKQSKRTLDDVKHDLHRQLTVEKLLNKEINSKITVTDSDVTNYFNQHKAEFNLMETMYHLAQIQVTTIPSATPVNLQGSKATSEEEAKKKIQAIKNQLDSGGDFGTIAMNFSENPQNASNGGDMGLLSESQLRSNPIVYAAVTKLKPKQVTDIITFPDPGNPKRIGGYAIFELLEKLPAGQREINDPRVQQNIRQQLHDGRSQLLKGAYFEMLRDQAKVENFLAEQIFKNDAR
jgi:peptidyl-prolyl cis-trans isomerase SurA